MSTIYIKDIEIPCPTAYTYYKGAVFELTQDFYFLWKELSKDSEEYFCLYMTRQSTMFPSSNIYCRCFNNDFMATKVSGKVTQIKSYSEYIQVVFLTEDIF